MGTPVLFLVNPNARRGGADMTRAKKRLVDAGLDLIEVPALNAAAISELIRGYKGRVESVIVGGGDGTLNAAAAGLYDTQLPLGILPLGTANDLARTLQIPFETPAAADVIAAGYQRRIDLGIVNDRYFFNAASLGLSVQITRKLSGPMKSRWGAFAYVIAAARVLAGARPFRVEIEHEGQTIRVKTSQIVVGNGHYFGGGMVIDANARIDDGLLHLYSLELHRWWQSVPLLPALLRGTLAGSSRARTLIGSEFRVRPLRRRRHINTDGEITTHTPGHFRVIPRALWVFAPAPAGEEGP